VQFNTQVVSKVSTVFVGAMQCMALDRCEITWACVSMCQRVCLCVHHFHLSTTVTQAYVRSSSNLEHVTHVTMKTKFYGQ